MTFQAIEVFSPIDRFAGCRIAVSLDLSNQSLHFLRCQLLRPSRDSPGPLQGGAQLRQILARRTDRPDPDDCRVGRNRLIFERFDERRDCRLPLKERFEQTGEVVHRVAMSDHDR